MRERNKNGISSFLFSGSSMDVFSATGEETRWFSFLFSSLKSLYLRAFLELWPCFFLISGREGKWCFFISCKASGYKKSLMPRGSAAQGFVVYYDIFFSSFPLLSPIQTLSGSVILRINGSGRGHSIFALQRKYIIALKLGQATLADEPLDFSLKCATGSFISRHLLLKLEF